LGAGGKSSLGQSKLQPIQPLSTRKALGNITNTVKSDGLGNADKQGGKQVPGPTVGRRAFGDITNTAGPNKAQSADIKPSLPSTSKTAPVEVAVAAPAPKTLAETYAEGGVEKPAGKGWHQLEVDRLLREEEQVEQRVAAVTAILKEKPNINFLQDIMHDDDSSGSDSDSSSMDLSSPEPEEATPR